MKSCEISKINNMINSRILSRLNHISTLPQNWDEEDADPISLEAIEEAKIILKELEPHNLQEEFIVPGKNGEVIIEYGTGTKRLIEIIIHPDRSRSMITYSKDKAFKSSFNLEEFLTFVNYKENQRSKNQ